MVVDEGYTVDTPCIILAKHHINALAAKQTHELLAVATTAVHCQSHIVADFGLPPLCSELLSIVGDTLLHTLVAETLPDKRGLDGRADRLTVLIGHRVDDTRIGFAIELALDLLCLDVEAREHGTILAEGLETIRGKDTLENVGYLLLYIATGVVRLFQIRFQ